MMLAGMSLDVSHEIEKERALAAARAELERLATTDAMTGLANRRVFEERIAAGFAEAARHERGFALMVMEIDDFKRRNDTYGHAAGDVALRELGRVLLDTIRAGEVAARIGGEEFAILLPDSDGISAAPLAERIQTRLREWDASPMPLTVSIGIACVSAAVSSWDRLLSKADDAMYEAKRSGKNRIVLSQTCHVSTVI
jgi:diguanylate cyclase (GGDEF)-like protein